MSRPVTTRLVRPVAFAGVALLLTACSAEGIIERVIGQAEGVDDVSIDGENGSFSIGGEEGEFSVDIDEDGSSTFSDGESEVSSQPTDEVPPEISEAIAALPDSFQPEVVTRQMGNDGSGVFLQGEVSGDQDELLDQLEQGIRDADWPEVERAVVAPGFGSIAGTEGEDGGRGIAVNLILDEESGDGQLQIIVTEDIDEVDEFDQMD